MKISITNLQSAVPVPATKITTTAQNALRKLRLEKTDLSVVFVGEKRMRRMNKEYLGHDYVTDVITFNYADVSCPNVSVGHLAHGLGPRQKHSGTTCKAEIIICPAVAVRNAKRFGISVERELKLYVVHGILHLAGYDDHSPADILKIRQKEQELVSLRGAK
jgi:probable rRNA maturation factor